MPYGPIPGPPASIPVVRCTVIDDHTVHVRWSQSGDATHYSVTTPACVLLVGYLTHAHGLGVVIEGVVWEGGAD